MWVNDGAIFLIVIREDLRKQLCFCWNWKSLKALTVLTQFWYSKYFGPLPVSCWHLKQWCHTSRCCVSLIRCCGLFISEVFTWNYSLKFFPRFCVIKQKPAYSYLWIILFISTIWLPQVSPVVHGMAYWTLSPQTQKTSRW